MSLLRRLTLAIGLLALAGLQSGCGFQPVYGERAGSQPASELQHIAVARVPDRVGHRLRDELYRLFGTDGQAARYHLAIKLDERNTVTAIDRDSSERRSNLRLVAAISLTEPGTEAPLYQTTVISDAGIDQLPSNFATLVAEDAAERRAVERLARDIRQRLALYFARRQ
jgi:LPS-assembly lipoprotein